MDFAFGVLLLAAGVAAGGYPSPDGGHVRTTDMHVRGAIDDGVARSPLFRDLVAQINASDVIVYVESDCGMPERLLGRLTFMSAAGDRRYVMVGIRCGLNQRGEIAMLAHEMRHALEIACAKSVVDQPSLADEYQRIGFMSNGFKPGSAYDTRAAIEAGERVWAELSRSGE